MATAPLVDWPMPPDRTVEPATEIQLYAIAIGASVPAILASATWWLHLEWIAAIARRRVCSVGPVLAVDGSGADAWPISWSVEGAACRVRRRHSPPRRSILGPSSSWYGVVAIPRLRVDGLVQSDLRASGCWSRWSPWSAGCRSRCPPALVVAWLLRRAAAMDPRRAAPPRRCAGRRAPRSPEPSRSSRCRPAGGYSPGDGPADRHPPPRDRGGDRPRRAGRAVARLIAVERLPSTSTRTTTSGPASSIATGFQAGDPGVLTATTTGPSTRRSRRSSRASRSRRCAVAEVPDRPTTAPQANDLPEPQLDASRGSPRRCSASRRPCCSRSCQPARRAVPRRPHLDDQVHEPGHARVGAGVLRARCRRVRRRGRGGPTARPAPRRVARRRRGRVRHGLRGQVPVRRRGARDRRRLAAALARGRAVPAGPGGRRTARGSAAGSRRSPDGSARRGRVRRRGPLPVARSRRPPRGLASPTTAATRRATRSRTRAGRRGSRSCG